MTNDEWFNVRPKDSFAKEPYKVKPEPLDYNIVIEYPKKVFSKEEVRELLKRRMF
jgi:hypothetical protein